MILGDTMATMDHMRLDIMHVACTDWRWREAGMVSCDGEGWVIPRGFGASRLSAEVPPQAMELQDANE